MPHLLINGLSVGSGGGFTVVKELARHLELARTDWSITLLLTSGRPLHDQLASDLSGSNIRISHAPKSTAKRLGRLWFESRQLSRVLDVLHVDMVLQPTGTLVAKTGRPTLIHIGDPWPYLPVRDLWYDPLLATARRMSHGKALKLCDAVSFTSGFLRKVVCEHFNIPLKGDVFYNGLPDTWRTSPTSDVLPLSSRKLELLSVSQVSPYKGQRLVVMALASLIKRRGLESVVYRVVGHCDRKNRADLESLATKLGVSDRVKIEGRLDQKLLEDAYRTARCFTLPSVCESFGIPAIEAMSFGVPVVVANAAAIPEVCADAALLSTPGDVNDLSEKIAKAMLNDALAADLIAKGHANVTRFNWLTTADQMAARLESII